MEWQITEERDHNGKVLLIISKVNRVAAVEMNKYSDYGLDVFLPATEIAGSIEVEYNEVEKWRSLIQKLNESPTKL